jgi:YVTN family beta-propeller protein
MKKIKFGLFTLLIILGVFLAGCSSNSNKGSESTNKGNEENSPSTETKKGNQSDSENTQYYFTANEGGSISKIAASSNEVVKEIKVEGAVHNVQVSPDGKILGAIVVPGMNHGGKSMEMNGQALFYDTNTNDLLKSVDVGNHPAHIVFTADGKYALVTNNEDNNVSVIDMNTMSVTKTIDTGKGPHGFRISADNQKAYIANMGENSVSVLNLETMKEEKKITVGSTPVTTGITSDGKTLVATLNGENMLAIVDLTTDQVVRVEVGKGPAQVYIDGNNQFAYVANQGTEDAPSHSVSVVDLASKKVTATIETGKGAHGVVTSPDSKHLYVTNMYENTVTVIDTEQNKVLDTIKVGKTPNGISIMK